MNKQNNPETRFEVEDQVRRYYESPQAPTSLADRLERQLRSRHAELVEAQPSRPRWTGRIRQQLASLTARPAASLAVLAAVILLTGLFWIGPNRVLAAVERWLRYVPGVGFVNMDRTRVLASPVLLIRQDTSVQVDQVIASPANTSLRLTFSSPPAGDGRSENPLKFDFRAALLLPDGTRLEAKSWTLDPNGASVEFEPVPDGIYRLTLEINRLPFHPAETYPENWQIELVLQDANGDLPDSLFPQPYTPENATASANGVTVRVAQVAQAREETAVEIQARWDEPNWFAPDVDPQFMRLEDDQGLRYAQAQLSASSAGVSVVAVVPGEPVKPGDSPATAVYTQTLHFAPLSLSSHQVSMTLGEFRFSAPSRDVFSIDLGQDPQVGDHWQLDMPLEAAGLPIQLVNARVTKETHESSNRPEQDALVLEFNLPENTDRMVTGFGLDGLKEHPTAQQGSYDHGTLTTVLFFDQLPTGRLDLVIDQVQIRVKGPWIFHWTVPQGAGSEPDLQVAPRRIYPVNILAEKNGLVLKLDEAILSDRVTTLKLSAHGAGEGWQLFDLRSNSLKNQWGQEVNRSIGVALKESTAGSLFGLSIPLPGALQFGPLPTLSSQLTLELESVELFHPGQAAIDVEVPAGLTFAPEQVQVTMAGAGREVHQATQRRLVSDPWPVDQVVDISGYRVHFTQAHLEKSATDSSGSTMLVVAGELVHAGEHSLPLAQLRLSSLTTPDGLLLTGDPARQDVYGEYLGYSGTNQQTGSDVPQAFLSIRVRESLGQPMPGIYHVEFGGVVATVMGPWKLSFDLR